MLHLGKAEVKERRSERRRMEGVIQKGQEQEKEKKENTNCDKKK